jgi:hypothetical protein
VKKEKNKTHCPLTTSKGKKGGKLLVNSEKKTKNGKKMRLPFPIMFRPYGFLKKFKQ